MLDVPMLDVPILDEFKLGDDGESSNNKHCQAFSCFAKLVIPWHSLRY